MMGVAWREWAWLWYVNEHRVVVGEWAGRRMSGRGNEMGGSGDGNMGGAWSE